jgi:hypothetical protein
MDTFQDEDGNKRKFSILNQKENAQWEDRDEDGGRLEKMSRGKEEGNGRKLSFGSTEVGGEAISVTGRGGPQGCETSRLSQLEVRSALRVGRRPFAPRNIPGTHVCP